MSCSTCGLDVVIVFNNGTRWLSHIRHHWLLNYIANDYPRSTESC